MPWSRALVLAGATGLLACNPLAFDKLLQDAPVFEFKITGPSGSIHQHVVVAPAPMEGEPNHALVASARGVGLAWLSLNGAGRPITTVIDNQRADAIAFPIESSVDIIIGGLALIPAAAGGAEPDALVALLSPNEPFLSRVVRIRPFDFNRVTSHKDDIVVPKVDDVSIPGFASALATINLDGPPDDPAHEVAVGSEQGLLVFDSVGANTATYEQAANTLEFNTPGACTGVNQPDCFAFTRCEALADLNGLAAANVGAGATPVFLVGTEDGVTFVAVSSPPVFNAVGAPIYDCAADLRVAPEQATTEFGSAFLAHDFDGDGTTDLAVGDPLGNTVYVYQGGAGDLEDTPSITVRPDDATTAGFGAALGTADLGGNLGGVFVVGAPGTTVSGKETVGTAVVYEEDLFAPPFEPILDLRDQNPDSGSQHGLWVGGLSLGSRDELLIMGRNEGRVHHKINPLDPAPGEVLEDPAGTSG